MKAIKFKEFRNIVGNTFIASAINNFPKRNYKYKSVGNVIYLLAKPTVKLSEIEKVKFANPGKQVLACVLPFEVMTRTGL